MRSVWRTLDRRTTADIALVCAADALVGASFGAITVSGGLPGWLPVALSLLVFAGGAQFAAVGAVLAGGSAASGVVAGLVLNARLLPFGVAVADVLGTRWPARLLGAHLVVDESVAFTIRQDGPDSRRAAFWVTGASLFVVWNLSVLGGVLAGRFLHDTDAIGLDAAFPAVLLALVLPTITGRTRRPAVLGALLAVAATTVLPPGLPVLVSLLGLVLVPRRSKAGRT